MGLVVEEVRYLHLQQVHQLVVLVLQEQLVQLELVLVQLELLVLVLQGLIR
jgi:hypothetical protein